MNPYRTVGAMAILGLAACSPNFNATTGGGETDNLYFMASDAKIATEFAVKNNNPENFKEIEQIQSFDQDADNFSAKNVNPEYIAKYQRSSESAEAGTVYFDDSQNSDTPQGDVNVNAYDNYRGSNGGGTVTNNYFMNPMMGMGMGMNPMMGMGMYDPFWGMGMYDPFWGSGFGMRPGFNMSFGMGMGFGFGSPFMRSGFGWGSPFMRRGMGMGLYDPFWGSGYGMRGMYGYGGGMWGNGFYNYNPVIIMPGGNEGVNRRQIVQGGRPYRNSALTNSSSRSRSAASQPSSMRSVARRDATANGVRSRTASSRNNFDRSQNDYYNTATAAPARRNINSPAMNRSGSTSNRSSYATPNRTGSSMERRQAPANINSRRTGTSNSRSSYSTPSRTRSSSPSYNRSRSTSPNYQRSTSPSRSRSTYSAPSRSSSSYSAPSRGSSGGSSRGGGSVGGGRRGN
ncbi:MAG: hypothetical protein WDZ72_10805 [Cyclobacteriaceae bacterium]